MPLQFNNREEEEYSEKEYIQNWLKKSHEDLIILFFASNWSGSSQLLMENLKQVQNGYADHIYFLTLNIEEWPRTAETFQIHSVPGLIFLSRGEVVEHLKGVVSRGLLSRKLDELIE